MPERVAIKSSSATGSLALPKAEKNAEEKKRKTYAKQGYVVAALNCAELSSRRDAAGMANYYYYYCFSLFSPFARCVLTTLSFIIREKTEE